MRASSRSLAQWYPRLAAGLEAGLTFQQVITTMPGPAESGRAMLAGRLAAGDTLPEALERGARWLPEVDRQLIGAGAASGRLPDVLRRLTTRHEERVRAAWGMVLAGLYPLAVGHFAVLAFPVQLLVAGGGFPAYAAAVLKILVPLWMVIITMIVAVRLRFRPAVFLIDLLPFVRGFRRNRALADLAYVLEAQVVAGFRHDVAWLQAAISTGDRRLEPVAVAAAEAYQRGEPISGALAGRTELPGLFVQFYANGEQTGRLDESLGFLQRQFREAAATRLKIASMVYPALLFCVVAVLVAVNVIRFYQGYFDQLNQMME